MSPSGLHVNKPVLFVLFLGLILLLVWWMKSPAAPVKLDLPSQKSWKTGDWKTLPAGATENLDKVKVEHVKDKKITVGNLDLTVAYREVKPENAKLDVLLLHGMKYSSKTWAEEPLFTLQILSTLGYHAVALDLPGFGDSSSIERGDKLDPASYIETVVKELQLNAPVIISPSMSGKYSLPYLFKDSNSVLTRCQGFVPVAPGDTDSFTDNQYMNLKVPALIVYGSKDKSLGISSAKKLQLIPESVVDEIPGAEHACYLDKPDEFHSHLYTFLSALEH